MKFLNKFWEKSRTVENKTQNSQTTDQTYIDILISLNKDQQIDFSLYLKDHIDDIDMDSYEYAVLCGKFLNSIFSNKLKKDAVEILDSQIKNENNTKLVNNIISVLKIINNSESNNKQSKDFIRPTEVFSKYIP